MIERKTGGAGVGDGVRVLVAVAVAVSVRVAVRVFRDIAGVRDTRAVTPSFEPSSFHNGVTPAIKTS